MATVTLNISAANATRLQDALGESMELRDEDEEPRLANMGDLKEYIISDLVQFVRNSERRVARRAADLTLTPVAIT